MPDTQVPNNPPIQNSSGDRYLPWMPAQSPAGVVDNTSDQTMPATSDNLTPAVPIEPPPSDQIANVPTSDPVPIPVEDSVPMSTPRPQSEPVTAPLEPGTEGIVVTDSPLDQANPLVAAALSNPDNLVSPAPGMDGQVISPTENAGADASTLPNWDSYSQQWTNPDGTGPTDSQMPIEPQPITAGIPDSSNPLAGMVAPEDVSSQKKSKIMHIVLSLLIVIMVISGASFASFIYVKKGVSFIKLPKLPFIKEPESSVELVDEEPQEVGPIIEDWPLEDNADIGSTTPPLDNTDNSISNEENLGDSLTVTVPTDWRSYTSKKWGYTFKYPLPWEIYPRDTGAIGETTMVASQPLSSLEGDIRILPVDSQSMVIGFGALAYMEGDDLAAFLKQSATTYQLSQMENKIINGRSFVSSLTIDGKVLYYFTEDSQTKLVYFIAVKPASYDSQYADQVQRVVASLSVQGVGGQ